MRIIAWWRHFFGSIFALEDNKVLSLKYALQKVRYQMLIRCLGTSAGSLRVDRHCNETGRREHSFHHSAILALSSLKCNCINWVSALKDCHFKLTIIACYCSAHWSITCVNHWPFPLALFPLVPTPLVTPAAPAPPLFLSTGDDCVMLRGWSEYQSLYRAMKCQAE